MVCDDDAYEAVTYATWPSWSRTYYPFILTWSLAIGNWPDHIEMAMNGHQKWGEWKEAIEEEAEHSYPGTLPGFRQEKNKTKFRAVANMVKCYTFKSVCGPYAETFHKYADVRIGMFPLLKSG